MNDILSHDEAAAALHVSTRTVRRMVQYGLLTRLRPAGRAAVVRRSEVEALIARIARGEDVWRDVQTAASTRATTPPAKSSAGSRMFSGGAGARRGGSVVYDLRSKPLGRSKRS